MRILETLYAERLTDPHDDQEGHPAAEPAETTLQRA